MSKMTDLVALAKTMASERESDQHPVATLMSRAVSHRIHGREFDDALAAAVGEGWLILTPGCGPKQLGVFKLSGK